MGLRAIVEDFSGPLETIRAGTAEPPARAPVGTTAFARLVWLSSHFDSLAGRYVLACDRDQAETDRALRLAHGRAFADWLGCSLPEQAADLSLYLSEHRDGNVLTQLESWRAGRDGLCLVPKDALEVDRSLFESDLKMVLQLLGGGRSTPKSRRRQGSRLQAIFNLLESADVSRLTIEEVAAECALSANWFRQWCRQNTGSSFHGLVRQVQMRRAAHLLRTTVSPAAEVAAEIGYQHPPNFCRDFKTMFRITPHQYRRLWRGIKARWFRSPDGEAETSKENHQI